MVYLLVIVLLLIISALLLCIFATVSHAVAFIEAAWKTWQEDLEQEDMVADARTGRDREREGGWWDAG